MPRLNAKVDRLLATARAAWPEPDPDPPESAAEAAWDRRFVRILDRFFGLLPADLFQRLYAAARADGPEWRRLSPWQRELMDGRCLLPEALTPEVLGAVVRVLLAGHGCDYMACMNCGMLVPSPGHPPPAVCRPAPRGDFPCHDLPQPHWPCFSHYRVADVLAGGCPVCGAGGEPGTFNWTHDAPRGYFDPEGAELWDAIWGKP
jgi:hypothetical protein